MAFADIFNNKRHGSDKSPAERMAAFDALHKVQIQGVKTKMSELQIGEKLGTHDKKAGKTKDQIITGTALFPDRGFHFLINGTIALHPFQSVVLADDKVVHAQDLKVGDSLTDTTGKPLTITTIERVKSHQDFARLSIDGDHTFILNGIVAHNASRYWVAGTGNSNDNTNHWAASSGGAPGASLPTTADDVFIDTNSGFGAGGTLSLVTANLDCNNFVATVGHAWTMDGSVKDLSVNGNTTLEAGMTMIGNGYLDFNGAGSYTITWNGADFSDGQLNFYSGSALGTWTLQDSITKLIYLYMETGTLDANDFDVKSTTIDLEGWDGTTQVILYMGNGTWWTNFWNNYGEEAFKPTIHAEGSTIKISNLSGIATSPYMSGGGTGSVYNNIYWVERGTGNGTCFCNNNNTFNDLRIAADVSITFDAGGTTTFSSLTLDGTSGHPVTITADSSTWQRTLDDNYQFIGGELITNGSFTGNDTGWTVGASWVYGSNHEIHAGGGSEQELSQTIITAGKTYRVIYTVNVTTGGILHIVGGTPGNQFYSSGTYTDYVTAEMGTDFVIWALGLNGFLDDVSVMEAQLAPHHFVKTSGSVLVDWVDLIHNAASGGASFRTGTNSTHGTEVTGWNWAYASSLSDTAVIVDTVVKATGRALTETIILAEVFAKIVTKVKTFTETIIIKEDAFVKTIGRSFSDAVTIAETFLRSISRFFDEPISIADRLAKKVSKTFTETITLTDALKKLIKVIGSSLGRDKDTNTKYGTKR